MKSRLSDQQQEALRLRFVEGLSVTEAAARLGVEPNLVTQWHRRSMERLREELRGQTSQFFSK